MTKNGEVAAVHRTAADFDGAIREILAQNRPGAQLRGCHSHMEIYAHRIHHAVVAPLLRELHKEGRIGPVEDHGHDLEFTQAWNRLISGAGEAWDCRSVTQLMLQASTPGVTIGMLMNLEDHIDRIDATILDNLPELLAGARFDRPSTTNMMTSWVTGRHVWARFAGLQPELCEKDGTALEPAELSIGSMPIELEQDQPIEMVGIIGFHASDIDHDTSDNAWVAFMSASRPYRRHDDWDSMAGLVRRQILCQEKLGISWLGLKQDEAVSVEAGPDGFTVYRGAVEGLKSIVDEGQFMIGSRTSWMKVLEAGGFSKAGAGAWLDQICATDQAFRATVPAGSSAQACIDPETQLGFDLGEHETSHSACAAEALPIFAAGTFEMPEMLTHRERKRAALAACPDHTPEP